MIFWIIIGLGLLIGIGAILAFDASGSGERIGLLAGWTIGGVVVAFVVCWFLGEIWSGDPVSYNPPDKSARILNLEDNHERRKDANGAFVLVAGGFSYHEDVEQTYSFYQETSDGSYFLHKISMDSNTKIRIHFIAEGEIPHVIRKQPNPHWTTPGWIAPMDLILEGTRSDSEATEVWTLYVPKGTIRTIDKFELDNK